MQLGVVSSVSLPLRLALIYVRVWLLPCLHFFTSPSILTTSSLFSRPFLVSYFFPTFQDSRFSGGVPEPAVTIPTREEQLQRLQAGAQFDVLVIGGGATGTLFLFSSVVICRC